MIDKTNAPKTNILKTKVKSTNIAKSKAPKTSVAKKNTAKTRVPKSSTEPASVAKTKVAKSNVKRAGRPTTGSEVIIVRIEDKVVSWCGGIYAGNAGLVKEAKWNALIGIETRVGFFGELVESDKHDALGALASMIAVAPGRASIVEVSASLASRIGTRECISLDDSTGGR